MVKCLNRSLKTVKDIRQRISDKLNLGVLISDDQFHSSIAMYTATYGIDESDILDYIPDFEQYLEEYFGINETFEPYDENKELYQEWEEKYSNVLNKVVKKQDVSQDFINEVLDITEYKAKIIELEGDKIFIKTKAIKQQNSVYSWSRTAKNNYEVSSEGDKRFSALNAKFNNGTIIEGVDVGGKSIEEVYQKIIKKSGKGQPPSKNSKLYKTSVNSYTGDIVPEEDTIFVFGSNPEGRHGAGAAKIAVNKFGAKYGVGEGITGNSYALPTKDLRITKNKGLRSISENQIIENIKKLYETAKQHPNKQFKIAYRNTNEASLNGYTGLEMIEMFKKAGSIPNNIVFSKEWVDTGKFNLSKEELENYSYYEGYLPLWQEWAKQNPGLIEELRSKAKGKVLTDQFAYTNVSQARALADILNQNNRIDNNLTQAYNSINMPEFTTSKSQNYTDRTRENAEWSDITVAIAKDFTTFGERATKKYSGNKYLSILWNTNESNWAFSLEDTLNKIGIKRGSKIKLNVAGNGIYTLNNHNISQEDANEYVYRVVSYLKEHLDIIEIRSGGQTGVDEAGIIAAQRLGIKSSVHTTADWKFRGKDNKDIINNEKAFKERFGIFSTNNQSTNIVAPKPKQKTLDDYVADVEEMINNFNKVVKKDADFDENHKYYITVDGKDKEADFSVTGLCEEILNEKFKDNGIVYPQKYVGNDFDKIVRTFFINADHTPVCDTMNNEVVVDVKDQLILLKESFDTKFGKGKYKVITKDWSLGGKAIIKGKEKLVAGSVDMLVVTDAGEVYLYDMKTRSNKDGVIEFNKLIKYKTQLNFYKNFIEKNSNIKIKDIGIIVGGYELPSKNYNNYSIITDINENEHITYNGEQNFIKKISIITNGINNYIKNLDEIDDELSNKVKYGDRITAETIKAEVEKSHGITPTNNGVQNNNDNLFETKAYNIGGNNEPKNEIVKNDTSIFENPVDISREQAPISQTDEQEIANSMIKQISLMVDDLKNDDIYRERYGFDEKTYGKNYFVDKKRDDILTSRVFIHLAKMLRDNLFEKNGDDINRYINENFFAILKKGVNLLKTLEIVPSGVVLSSFLEKYQEETENLQSLENVEQQQVAEWAENNTERSYVNNIKRDIQLIVNRIVDYEYDEEGNIKTDEDGDFVSKLDICGFPTYIPKETVINLIFHYVKNSKNSTDMINKLKIGAKETPWLNQIVTKLENPNTPDLKTKFFVSFKRCTSSYSKEYITDNGDIESIPLTVYTDSDRLLENFRNTIENDLKNDLGNTVLARINDKTIIVKPNAEKIKTFNETLVSLKRESGIEGKRKYIKTLLTLLGVDVNSIITSDMDNDLISFIQKTINDIYNKCLKENQFNLSDYCSRVNSLMRNPEFQNHIVENFEISVYDDDKNRMTYTNPTWLQLRIEALQDDTLTDKEYVEMVKNLYDTEQFYYLNSNNERVYYSNILRMLTERDDKGNLINKDFRKSFRHYIKTTFNKKPYLKQSDSEYFDSLLTSFNIVFSDKASKFPIKLQQYENVSEVINGNEETNSRTLYRIPLMSDKNASEMIVGPLYPAKTEDELKDMKDIITNKVFSFFLFEIKRMASVYQQLLNDEKSDVNIYHIPRKNVENLSDYIEIDEEGNKKLKPLTIESFKALKNLSKFKGFDFNFITCLNNADDKDLKDLYDIVVKCINITIDGKNIPVKVNNSLNNKFKKHFKKNFSELSKNFALRHTGVEINKDVDEGLKDKAITYECFYWNDYLNALNIYHLTTIDLAFYNGSTDLQKRYAQIHSSTIKPDTETTHVFTYNDNGNKVTKKVSDGNCRVVIVNDKITKSFDTNVVMAAMDKAIAKYDDNSIEKNNLIAIKTLLKKEYDKAKIDISDGQSFSTLTGFWKKLKMLGESTPELDEAVMHLSNNPVEQWDFSKFNICVQAFKSFVYTQVLHQNKNTVLGEYRIPMQIKHSEAMIALSAAILRHSNKNEVLVGMFDAIENSHWTVNGEYKNDGIDMICMDSTVKVGLHNAVNLNDCENAETVEEVITNAPILTFPFTDWGKQQETPAHTQDHEQPGGSQMKILAVSDLPENFRYIDGDKELNKQEFLQEYFSLIRDDYNQGILNIFNTLGFKNKNISEYTVEDIKEMNKKLSDMLLRVAYNSGNVNNATIHALSLNENGDFNGPLGDPSTASIFYKAVFSLIKGEVNYEMFQGGPIVLESSFGIDENLHTKFDDKGGLYYEIITTFPTSEMEKQLTLSGTNKDGITKRCDFVNNKLLNEHKIKRDYKEGSIISVDDALLLGWITEDQLWCRGDRIPTEDKYSMMRCRIKDFLPRQFGEYLIAPKEIVHLSGMDFDIDKVFMYFKYFGKDLTESQKRKNKILDMQLATLSDISTVPSILNPGSFEELANLADEIDQNRKVDISLTTLDGQLYYRKNNVAGKNFVGVAALNNVCHAMGEMAKLGFKTLPAFTIDNIKSEDVLIEGEEYRFDKMYSPFDNSRISRTIGMFVGASADNAKNPTLASINFTPETASLGMGLLRIGIPLKTVVYMLNTKLVRMCQSEKDMKNLIKDIDKQYKEMTNGTSLEASFDFDTEKLRLLATNKQTPNTDTEITLSDFKFTQTEYSVLAFLVTMMPYCRAISNISVLLGLNSTKNAVGPDIYDTVVKSLQIEKILNNTVNIGEDDILGDSIKYIYNSLPFLKPLVECYTDILPIILRRHSPLFQKEFKTVLNKLTKANVKLDGKFVKKLYNQFLVYKAARLGVVDFSEKHRQELFYNIPVDTKYAKELIANNTFVDALIVKPVNISSFKNNKRPVWTTETNLSNETLDNKELISTNFSDMAIFEENINVIGSTKQYTKNLLEYFIMRFGFEYGRKTPMSIASIDVKSLLPNYYQLFNESFNSENADKDYSSEANEFLTLFNRNNSFGALIPYFKKDSLSVSSKPFEVKKSDDGVSRVSITKQNLYGIGISEFGFNNAGELYLLEEKQVKSDDSQSVYTFIKCEKLGVDKNLLEYESYLDSKDVDAYNSVSIIKDSKNAKTQDDKIKAFDETLYEYNKQNVEQNDGSEDDDSSTPVELEYDLNDLINELSEIIDNSNSKNLQNKYENVSEDKESIKDFLNNLNIFSITEGENLELKDKLGLITEINNIKRKLC